jgi:hypothetical protein
MCPLAVSTDELTRFELVSALGLGLLIAGLFCWWALKNPKGLEGLNRFARVHPYVMAFLILLIVAVPAVVIVMLGPQDGWWAQK